MYLFHALIFSKILREFLFFQVSLLCFPIVDIPIFVAISDFSGSIINTYPLQKVVKVVPPQIGHLSPSPITLLFGSTEIWPLILTERQGARQIRSGNIRDCH